MRYARFEIATMGVATLLVLGMVITTLHDAAHAIPDLTAAVALLVVLSCAVHWGRRGGFAAAIAAAVLYTLVSVPHMTETGLSNDFLLTFVLRVATFGVVGIGGGEISGRVRHLLSRFGHTDTFDEWSNTFNQQYAARALEKALASFERYDHTFAVVILSLSADVTTHIGPKRVRTIVRSVSNYVRGNLRMVDELARLDDGRFLAVLPETTPDGAAVAAARLAAGVTELLGASTDAVSMRYLSPESDVAAIRGLLESLSVPEAQSKSGVYSSPADSVRNPALESALSAPGASTLNMSTAARPEGSTKQ